MEHNEQNDAWKQKQFGEKAWTRRKKTYNLTEYDLTSFYLKAGPIRTLDLQHFRRLQAIGSYICSDKYGQWTRQVIKQSEKISLEKGTPSKNRQREKLNRINSNTATKFELEIYINECFRIYKYQCWSRVQIYSFNSQALT